MGKFNLGELISEGKVSKLDTNDGREQIEYIDIDRIDDDPNNFYELSSLDELAANIELLGLQQPLRVRTDPANIDRVIIVSGHRRRAAIRKLVTDGRVDLREIPCIRERAESSAALQELRLIYANSDTRKLTSAEVSKQAERVEALLYQLKEEGYEFPGRMRDHVAEACKVSKSKLSRLKVIRENLFSPLRGLWELGKINEAVAYACAQHSADMQQKLIEFSKQFDYYTTPDRWYETTVENRMEMLENEAKLKCGKGSPSGMCDNTEKRLVMFASSRAGWNAHCKKGKCCTKCPSLATCRAACPHLASEIQAAKEARKAQLAKEAADRAEHDRPRVDPITELWARFGKARQASGLSMSEYLAAAKIRAIPQMEKKHEDYEQGKKIKGDTCLPYNGGYGMSLYEIKSLCKAADVLGVSLDYLLCRTDNPNGLGDAPQGDGWITLTWIDGFRPPHEPRHAVAIFDCEGARIRQLVYWDGEVWRFKPGGPKVDAKCLHWFPVPAEEVVSDEDS